MSQAKALQRITAAMMRDPFGRHYGYPLSQTAGVRSGTMYRVLDYMLQHGLVVDSWETPDELTAKRPRRYYVLTDEGRNAFADPGERRAV